MLQKTIVPACRRAARSFFARLAQTAPVDYLAAWETYLPKGALFSESKKRAKNYSGTRKSLKLLNGGVAQLVRAAES